MRRRRSPPHLRLVVPVVDDREEQVSPRPQPDGHSGREVIEWVVGNLIRDAKTVTKAVMFAIGDEFVGHGLDRSLARSDVVRNAVFDIVVHAFHDRLVAGLTGNVDQTPESATETIDDLEDDFPLISPPEWMLRRIRSHHDGETTTGEHSK
jgi:hypothetical protein